MSKIESYHWEVTKAKNGELALALNNILLTSRYAPRQQAFNWIESELDLEAEGYLLFGLGLGYYLEAISKKVRKKIVVYYFNEEELKIFKKNNSDNWWKKDNIFITNQISELIGQEKLQFIIHGSVIEAIGKENRLFKYLETIKINQLSYKRFGPLLDQNYYKNVRLKDIGNYPSKQSNVACLVSSGPSLDTTISWLKEISNKCDIYVVGSALKMVLSEGIIPKAVVLSDAESINTIQFDGVDYKGDLFYLSTASHETVLLHKGPRYILCQKGYKLAEEFAEQNNLPLLETGGSVATTSFSLIEQLAYEKLILFGQDLGFTGEKTHAKFSTSGIEYMYDSRLKVLSNNGEYINTFPNLQVYLWWFEQKIKDSQLKVYNTAYNGALIHGAPFINKECLIEILINEPTNK